MLAGLPSALLLGGCTSLLTQEEAEFEAERAVVTQSAHSETNYSEVNRTEKRREQEYEGIDRTVVVINKLTEYARSVDLPLDVGGELARFTVLASPEVTIVPGDPANPIADMSNEDSPRRSRNSTRPSTTSGNSTSGTTPTACSPASTTPPDYPTSSGPNSTPIRAARRARNLAGTSPTTPAAA